MNTNDAPPTGEEWQKLDRYIYHSNGKPLNLGINHVKRIARGIKPDTWYTLQGGKFVEVE